ncbi:hypothetical protein FRC14_002951 [Serendipita sp. 396]|nr:hypothetical protein FRC14_002951 [Serendipita sp. 396]KAG8784051.1 hypothetical protein FRC15_004075 [Serendipita sp. 397]KAG8799919.1 hypothetical protein FRC16_004091 [Serendipita sp. 398]
MELDTSEIAMNASLHLLAAQLQTMEELFDPSYQSPNVKAHLSTDTLFMFSSFITSTQQIANLARQLTHQIQEHREIKKRLKIQCDISTAATSAFNDMRTMARTAPAIYRCPVEILNYIFEDIAEEGSHLMLPLLLVNKRFHRLVVHNTRLWTKIFLHLDGRLEEVNRLSEPYIETCLQRSKDALLDIRLEYNSIQGTDRFIHAIALDHLSQFITEKEAADFLSVADYFDGEINCPLYEQKVNHALDLVRLLVGRKGVNLQRWGSLVVSLPEWTFDAEIKVWKMITITATPNLHTLAIEVGDYFEDLLDENGLAAFPDLSGVVHLSMKGVTNLLVPANFASLKSLDIQLRLNHDILPHCKSLQDLTIRATWLPRTSPQTVTDIGLPLLTSLTLIGELAKLEFFQFCLPRLDHLCLYGQTDSYIPNIHAPHVQLISGPSTVKSAEEVTDYLSRLLSTFRATISLEIQADSVEISERYHATLCNMWREKQLHRSLRSIKVGGIGSLDLTIDDK